MPARGTTGSCQSLLAPTQELVAFAVALVFDVHVLFDRVGHAVLVDLHGMVDDHVGLDLRVDDLRISAKLLDGVTHGGGSTMHGTPVKSCMTTRDGVNWISLAPAVRRIPIQQGLDMIIRDVGAIDVAHQVLNKNLQRAEMAIDASKSDTVKVVILAAHLQGVSSWSSPQTCYLRALRLVEKLSSSRLSVANDTATLLQHWRVFLKREKMATIFLYAPHSTK